MCGGGRRAFGENQRLRIIVETVVSGIGGDVPLGDEEQQSMQKGRAVPTGRMLLNHRFQDSRS